VSHAAERATRMSEMRIGLVLGAGGVVGASWLMGALEALETETGWQPRDAQYIVGTSAGAVIGSLVAAGIPPAFMAAYTGGRPLEEFPGLEGLSELGELIEREAEAAEDIARRESGAEYRLHRGWPGLGPGSWRLALATLRNPTRHPPLAVLSGWLPRGLISTEPIKRIIERFVPAGWPDHPNLWIVGCDYATGRRVVFGREDAPAAPLADAVSASCAIPGFYRPVQIGGRTYVDGGVCSTSNLDLVADRNLDLVVCLNPASSLAPFVARSPADYFAGAMRVGAGRRLRYEARKVEALGSDLLLVQPSARDLEAMGPNLMARGRQARVIDQARVSTSEALRRARDDGHALPSASAPRTDVPSDATPPRRKRRRAA
jgi:NTE family protein